MATFMCEWCIWDEPHDSAECAREYRAIPYLPTWSAQIPGGLHCLLVGGAAHCEPRRWLPQRWSVCQTALYGQLDPAWFDMPATCDFPHVEEVYCFQERNDWPRMSEWYNPKDAGTCTLGAGPVCEVVV